MMDPDAIALAKRWLGTDQICMRGSACSIRYPGFVDGTGRLAAFVAEGLEARWDRLVHRRLPWVVTRQTEHLAHRLRTETEELVYNVSYVLVLFVLLLAVLLLGPGND